MQRELRSKKQVQRLVATFTTSKLKAFLTMKEAAAISSFSPGTKPKVRFWYMTEK